MTDSSLNKDKIKELITKINITLRSKEQPSEEDIIILKNLFMNMKKPCFLLGLLSFYERTKQPNLISFVKENISIFENDFSLKVNQLYVVYYALTNQECDPKRMLLEENFFKKYKSIFTDWFQFSYFDSLLFNPILGEEFGENFLAINERKKIINFFSENEIEKDFLECYSLISNEKYFLALSKLNLFLKKLKLFPKNLAYYLHSYNLISFCLFYNGYFIESITYLEMAGKLIQNDYFDKVIRLIKEGKGPMDVFLKELNSNYTNLKKIKDFSETEVDRFSLENKRLIFNLQTYNHFVLRDLIFEEKEFLIQRLINKTKIKDLYSLFEDLFKRNVLSVHKRGNFLVFTHYPSMLTQKIKITFDLKPILEKSKKTFLMKIEMKKDKQIFYKNRKRLDDKIAEKVNELNNLLIFHGVEHLLVGDFEFPFEKCAKLSNCKRIFKFSGLKIDKPPSSIFYVLDPQNKLPKTKERLMPLLKKYDGVVNRPAIQSDIKYTPINLFYFGHGNGQSFLNFKCDTESVYLFGCSSAKRFFFYGSNVHGAVYKYKCNKFIGCLWDISDKDIDLISKEYLVSGNLNRNVSRYEYLSGASVVVYELI